MSEEERNYVFAQLSSLPNAFQYVSVTNYIENLERENKKYKEAIDKAIKLIEKAKERRILLLLEIEVLDILKEVE